MLRLTIATIFVLVLGLNTQAHAAGCEPGRNEVTLFQHGKYKGACSVLGIGDYPNAKAMRFKNDSVSSIKVGANAEIFVMSDAKTPRNKKFVDYLKKLTISGNFSRAFVAERFRQSQPSLKGTRIGNDSISWVTVRAIPAQESYRRGECYPGDNSNSIAIYRHPDFKGDCRILSLGTYSNSRQMNIKNDSASSIEIGRGSKVYVKIYSGGNFKGRTETLTSSSPSLGIGAVGDNALTSIKVLRNKRDLQKNKVYRRNKALRR